MAYLAIIGSYSVNGVSQLHSDLLKEQLFRDFYELTPEKFNNKTNGITQRRWLLKSNPSLAGLITGAIGEKWITDLEELQKLGALKSEQSFRDQWFKIKNKNKQTLAQYIHSTMNVRLDPDSMFDVQVKRIHEYKRQLLFAFYIISQYLRIKHNPGEFICPRTFIIGGKAAPSYFMAKLTIKLINNIAQVINNDKSLGNKIRLVFLENYRVSLAERIFPASDLSEQISTAGTEASGTGNMKFMINGALTVGTLDGANVEMAQVVGPDNIFIFGLKTPEVQDIQRHGYRPWEFIERSTVLKEILKMVRGNFFCQNSPGLFMPIVNALTQHDPFLVCADFESYCSVQDRISATYLNRDQWVERSIVNVSKSGFFSSDRTIAEYAEKIWKVPVERKG